MAEENPKMKQFLEELNTLLDKYQYQLVPAATLSLTVKDKVPAKMEKPKKEEEPPKHD